MPATITAVDGDQLTNRVLHHLAWAALGDHAARAIVAPDHWGSAVMLAATVDHPVYVSAELAVVAYPGAGYQLWIGYPGRDTADCIDLEAGGAAANDDPRFVAAVQRAVDLWHDDPDALAGALLASDHAPYRHGQE